MSWAAALMLVLVIAVLVPWAIAELSAPHRDWVRELQHRQRAREIIAGCWKPGNTTRQDFTPSGGWLKDELKDEKR